MTKISALVYRVLSLADPGGSCGLAYFLNLYEWVYERAFSVAIPSSSAFGRILSHVILQLGQICPFSLITETDRLARDLISAEIVWN
jgi:hypothetical protein